MAIKAITYQPDGRRSKSAGRISGPRGTLLRIFNPETIILQPAERVPPMRKFAPAAVIALALAACSHPAPPAGRWEGVYEAGDAMIAARLEIAADGQIRVSAPDLLGIAAADDRGALHRKLAGDLATAWGDVAPRAMDFDGSVFRKPGGIAPQMIWKAGSKQMWLVVYLGTRPSIRIPMRAVGDFSDDPWPS